MRTRTQRIICCTILVGVLASPAFAQQYDWPMLGRDPQRSNYTPEAVGGPVDYPDWQFQWNWQHDEPIAWRVQIVSAEGVVAVGTFDGLLHAIDLDTGQTRWSYPTGGPILHSPAIVDGRVITGCHDGAVYAVNVAGGELAWRAETGGGIVASPLVVDGRVYIGNKAGLMTCLDAATGEMIWQTDVGAPIVQSAAWSESAGLVLTGTSTMEAIAVSADGEIAWRRQLMGQTLQESWPQVSERHGVVIYRTLGLRDMWDMLDGPGVGASGYFENLFEEPPAGIAEEQDGISQYLIDNPDRRTFWALDVTDGSDRYEKPVPVLWSWGISATMHAQAIDNEGDRTWVLWRSLATPADPDARVNPSCRPDIGLLDLATGRFQPHEIWYHSPGDMQDGLNGGDEPWPITVAADTIFMCQNHGPHGWSMHNNRSFCVLGSNLWAVWQVDPAQRTDAQEFRWSPHWKRNVMAPVFTHRRLLWTGGAGIGCYAAPEIEGAE